MKKNPPSKIGVLSGMRDCLVDTGAPRPVHAVRMRSGQIYAPNGTLLLNARVLREL